MTFLEHWSNERLNKRWFIHFAKTYRNQLNHQKINSSSCWLQFRPQYSITQYLDRRLSASLKEIQQYSDFELNGRKAFGWGTNISIVLGRRQLDGLGAYSIKILQVNIGVQTLRTSLYQSANRDGKKIINIYLYNFVNYASRLHAKIEELNHKGIKVP